MNQPSTSKPSSWFNAHSAALIVYCLLQGAILVIFKSLEASGQWDMADHIKYGSIILNTAVMLFYWIKRPFDWIPLGLLITLVADTFLIGLDDFYVLGVFCFCLVETCYALKLQKRLWRLRLIIIVAAYLILLLLKQNDLIIYLSFYSILMQLLNLIEACREKDVLFGIGLTLFFLCDLCVGFQNALTYLPGFPRPLLHAASYMIWVFYLPSQVIILLRWVLERKDPKPAKDSAVINEQMVSNDENDQ